MLCIFIKFLYQLSQWILQMNQPNMLSHSWWTDQLEQRQSHAENSIFLLEFGLKIFKNCLIDKLPIFVVNVPLDGVNNDALLLIALADRMSKFWKFI